MLRTDLENGLHEDVNSKINILFIKIFTNKFKTKSKQVYFQIILAPPKYTYVHVVPNMKLKYNNIFLESEAESIIIIHNTIKHFNITVCNNL